MKRALMLGLSLAINALVLGVLQWNVQSRAEASAPPGVVYVTELGDQGRLVTAQAR